MKIIITLEVADEVVDPEHSTGLTNDGYEAVFNALMPFGTDIDIRKEES